MENWWLNDQLLVPGAVGKVLGPSLEVEFQRVTERHKEPAAQKQ